MSNRLDVKSRRFEKSKTWENRLGERKLAYDLRNKGVDFVAREHEALATKRQNEAARRTEINLEAMARESERAHGFVVSTSLPDDLPRERPGLKSRTYYINKIVDGSPKLFKVTEDFSEGSVVNVTTEII